MNTGRHGYNFDFIDNPEAEVKPKRKFRRTICYTETPGKTHDFEERYVEIKQYRVDNYIPTVGDYYLPNGQKV